MVNKSKKATLHELFSNENFRARRALFTYIIIAFGLVSIVILGFSASGEVAKTAVQALEAIVMVSLVSYLGISAVDRSGILERVIRQPEDRQSSYPQQRPYPMPQPHTGRSGMVPIRPNPLPDRGDVGSSTGR
jgi:hypothetical protein